MISIAELEWIRTKAAERREEYLSDLRELVEQESPAGDVTALGGCARSVRALIERRVRSARVSSVSCPGGEIVIATIGPPEHQSAPVTILCHYDTVWPVGTLAGWPFAVDGDRATGPGVADMKAGIVQAVWAMAELVRFPIERPIRIVLNHDEETGSIESREVLEGFIGGSHCVLVLEPASGGALKTARKGIAIADVRVTGVASHAGLDPDAGASAIVELAQIISHVTALADHSLGTTVNVGSVSGGTLRNVVAARADAEIDIRAASVDEGERVLSEIRNLTAGTDSRVTIEVDAFWTRPVMERTAKIGTVWDVAAGVGSELGMPLEETAVGGASDANFAAAMDRPVLDGLGAVGGGPHARIEHIDIDASIARIALLVGVADRVQ